MKKLVHFFTPIFFITKLKVHFSANYYDINLKNFEFNVIIRNSFCIYIYFLSLLNFFK